MQAFQCSVFHSRASGLHPVTAAGCCLTSDEAALCLLDNPKERNLLEPSYETHLAGPDGRPG